MDSPRSRLALAAVLLVGLECSCGPAQDSSGGALPQRVLLISLDTLRADHTGFGGYSKPTTPFLDTLAERGVVFDNHFSNSNCTLPSHATMLTGLHYPSHGVRPVDEEKEDIHPLPSSAITMAERFQEMGYATTAFTSHGAWLNSDYGFDQGFDHFVSRWCEADLIMRDYLELVDERPSENSFTFLHFFDIHSDSAQSGPCLPYQSKPRLVERFAGEAPPGFTGCSTGVGRENNCASNYLKDISTKAEPLLESHRQYLIGLYDAGIRLLDEKLRVFFAELEKRGQLENTLIVITSDHGESFFEHGSMLHDTHHDEVAKVPLILVFPPETGVAPRRVQALTQSTDLAPTILDLCGLEPIGQVASLAPAIMLNEEPEDGQILFHGHVLVGSDEQGEYKYVKVGENRPPHFFDRSLDPMEAHNSCGDPQFQVDHRDRLLSISRSLNKLYEDCKSLNETLVSLDSGQGAKLSPERIAELKSLGYLGDSDGEEDEQSQSP
jgi:hypothetical protein